MAGVNWIDLLSAEHVDKVLLSSSLEFTPSPISAGTISISHSSALGLILNIELASEIDSLEVFGIRVAGSFGGTDLYVDGNFPRVIIPFGLYSAELNGQTSFSEEILVPEGDPSVVIDANGSLLEMDAWYSTQSGTLTATVTQLELLVVAPSFWAQNNLTRERPV